MFFKIGVLRNFAILTEKTPVFESLFIKERLQHSCFPVNIPKFLRTASPLVAASKLKSNISNVNLNKKQKETIFIF